MASSLRALATSAVASVGALWAAGCGPGAVASELAQAPAFEPGDAKCTVRKSSAKPLVVEWPSADRLELETRAKQGLVVVRYSGCEMSLLPRCAAPGNYAYVAATLKEDTVSIRNSDDLWASLPMGAAELEGKLEQAGELNVVMAMVGRFIAPAAAVHRDALEGECDGATHVLSGLTVGAFEFFAGAAATVGGGASVLGVGAKASSHSRRETLTRDGDRAACEHGGDGAPPRGCASVLRVEVAAVDDTPSPPPASLAPPTTATPDLVGPPGSRHATEPTPPDWVKGDLPLSQHDLQPRRYPFVMDDRIVQHQNEFEACYDRTVGRGPRGETFMRVFLDVTADGIVSEARFQRGSAKAPALHDCVLSILREVRFEVVSEPSRTNHEIVFPQRTQ